MQVRLFMLVISWIALSGLSLGAAETPAYTDKKLPGPLAVESVKFDWQDAKRSRQVPVKIYYPKSGSGPFPIIVFSHGLGGSREGYEYIGRHWASHGYVSIHMQHIGSDDAVWHGSSNVLQSLKATAADFRSALPRPGDVKFTIDQAIKLNLEDARFKGRLDTNHIGMAGHSFGGWTTLTAAGMSMGPGGNLRFGDARIKAAISMSAPAARKDQDKAYGSIRIPIYHLTGTEDNSPVGDTSANERRIPFDHIQGVDQFFLNLKGGDHMIFAGRSTHPGVREKQGLFLELIRMSTTVFWDAYLKEDAQAKAWLAKPEVGFAEVLGKEGAWEVKGPGVPRPH